MVPNTMFLGFVHPETVHGEFPLQLLEIFSWKPNQIIQAGSASLASNAKARNLVIDQFLESEAEWLLWIDSDARVFPDAPAKLRQEAERAQAVIVHAFSVGYNHNNGTLFVGAWDWNKEAAEYQYLPGVPEDPFWVDAVGCHFSIVHRSVFEDLLERPWHEDWERHPSNDRPMGHDLAFCWKLNQLGFRVLYCPTVPTWHVKDWHIGRAEWDDYNAKQIERQLP
jgi:GT2 family glycosyltransferase